MAVAAACAMLCGACHRQEVDFDELIAGIDAKITMGALKQADESVREAASLASSRGRWLSVLKRAYNLGHAGGSYETLYAISKAAIGEISGAEEIAALCVFASLRTGRIEMAHRYAQEYLDDERWRPLVNEAVLRKRSVDKGLIKEASEDNLLLAAVSSEDPVQLARAAELFGDSRFNLAAALKFAQNGEISTAVSTIEPFSAEYPQPALLLFYDAGRFDDAKRTFESLESGERLLVGGDIYLKLNDHDSALTFYRRLAAEAPGMSWIPYADAAIILAQRGEDKSALELIEAGKQLFPEVRQLLLAEIIVVFEAGEAARSEDLVSRYAELYPGDPEITVVSTAINPTDANRLRLESAFWNAFLQEPEQQRVANHLAASLIASNDRKGLARLVETWERENGETGWSRFLAGYHALMDDAAQTAAEAFEKSYELLPRWETAYNLSVLAGRAGDYTEAMEYVRMAENTLARREPDNVKTKAFLRAATARILYERGDFEIAIQEAMYALDLDPGANEAAILVELLEQKLE